MTNVPPAQPPVPNQPPVQPAAVQPPVVYPPSIAPQGYVQHPGYAQQQPYVQPQQGYAPPQAGQTPYFPNGSQGSGYAPSTGLQARVRGNWTWAFLLFGLPLLLIPVGIVILVIANIAYRS